MSIPIFVSLVKRYMKQTSPGSFTTAVEPSMLPSGVAQPGEPLVGLYRNPPPWEHSLIVFTPNAMCIVDSQGFERIAIEDVLDYERPKSKIDVTGVRLLTRNGPRFVRVAGRFGPYGNQKDAFSFIMMIRAALPSTWDPRVGDAAGDKNSE